MEQRDVVIGVIVEDDYIGRMFSEFLTRLVRPAPEPLADADARLALTALLVRIARSDGSYERAERDTIMRICAGRYAMTAGEASALVAEAEQLEGEAPDTVRFTRAIKDAVAYEDRLVVMADGARDPEEDALLRLAASLLGVTDQDSNAARLRVSR